MGTLLKKTIPGACEALQRNRKARYTQRLRTAISLGFTLHGKAVRRRSTKRKSTQQPQFYRQGICMVCKKNVWNCECKIEVTKLNDHSLFNF